MSALKVSYYTIFLIIIFSLSGSISQQKNRGINGGIVFSGNHQKPVGNSDRAKKLLPEKISSLHITKEELIDLKSNYSISFSTSFWYNFTSGYLLSIQNSSYKLKLKYISSQSSDTVLLKLTLNEKSTGLDFRYNKSNIYDDNWFNIRVDVNEIEGEISLTINNVKKTFKTSPFISKDGSDFYMGALPKEYECAPMILKDLQIRIEGNLEHNYLFSEMDGEIAHDSEGDLDAYAINPQWLINQHFFWESFDSFSYKRLEYRGIFQNPYKNEFGVLTNIGVDLYSFKFSSFDKIKYKEPFQPFYAISGLPNQDLLVGFCSGYPDNEAAIYNYGTGTWTGRLTKNTEEGYLYGGVNFVDSKNKSVFSFGGYGWYKVRNQLIKFNTVTKKWEEQKIKGDFISPRYMFFTLPSDIEDEYYILGGSGNKSGKQKDGFYNIWDLIKINISTLTSTKIFDWGKRADYNLVGNAIWADKNRSEIYAILQPTNPEGIFAKLGRLKIGDTSIVTLGDTNIVGVNRPAFGNLFNNYETNKLFSVISNEQDSLVKITIYSIRTPILSEMEYNDYYFNSPNGIRINRLKYSGWGVAIIALVSLPFASVYLLRYRRKKKAKLSTIKAQQKTEIPAVSKELEKNLITLFGGLKITDSNGINVLKELTPKQCEMLSLIAYYSYKDRDKNGLIFEKIDRLIWPDAPAENLKNNRNTIISKIRGYLKDVEGISIKVHANSVEFFANDKYLNEIESFVMLRKYFENREKIFDEEVFSNFLKIIQRGKFMENLSSEWSESIRMMEEAGLIETVSLYLNKIFLDGKFERCIEIIDSIYLHDPLNEELLSLKLKSLYGLGRHSIAYEVYNNFCKEFESFFAAKYKNTIKQLLKS